MTGVYSEKEILGDALKAQKAATSEFNLSANECAHEELRQTMMMLLREEHDMQQEVYEMMHAKGYYPAPDADMQKVAAVKQQFAQCVK